MGVRWAVSCEAFPNAPRECSPAESDTLHALGHPHREEQAVTPDDRRPRPGPSAHFRYTLAVPEEARDVPSATRHRHDLNGGLLRAVDDQIRVDRPEP